MNDVAYFRSGDVAAAARDLSDMCVALAALAADVRVTGPGGVPARAEPFGRATRDHTPRSVRDGHTRIGWGMAAGVWDARQSTAAAKAVFTADGWLAGPARPPTSARTRSRPRSPARPAACPRFCLTGGSSP